MLNARESDVQKGDPKGTWGWGLVWDSDQGLHLGAKIGSKYEQNGSKMSQSGS